jgi:dTDP-4-amino-4,6-dideoxygalactose transaminase
VHLQPAYKDRVRTAANMDVTEQLADEVLSLPMYPELLSAEVSRVIEVVNSYYGKSASV